jgi:hypothetical protein
VSTRASSYLLAIADDHIWFQHSAKGWEKINAALSSKNNLETMEKLLDLRAVQYCHVLLLSSSVILKVDTIFDNFS